MTDDTPIRLTVQPTSNAANAHQGIQVRSDLADEFGQLYGGDRDTYSVLGYEKEITAAKFRARYRRQDIARRIVELPPTDTWRHPPDVHDAGEETDTPFTQAVDVLRRQHRLFHYCKRADISAGIGEYGLLFIGFADGQPLSEPVNPGALSGPEDIAYFSAFSQDVVDEWVLGRDAEEELDSGETYDVSDPMYNKPVVYDINFADVGGTPDDEDIRRVHHTRLVHIAENPVESDLKGEPRLRSVWNRLVDLEKVLGSSAEMFWAGADRKFQFNIDAENAGDISGAALDDLDDEVQKLVHGLQHYIKTFNTDMEVFGGEDPDPSGVVEQLLKFIAGATGIPVRLLVGSERGELASTTDRANWFGQVESRQRTFAAPAILRPLLDMLIEYGIVPAPQGNTDSGRGYEIEWPNMFELTELELTEVALNRAKALQTVAPSNNTDLIAPMEQLMAYVDEGTPIDFEAIDEEAIGTPTPPAEPGDLPDDELPGDDDEPAEDAEEADQQVAAQWNAFRGAARDALADGGGDD